MSKNFDAHIEVLPNIPNMTKGKKVDPDVRSVLENPTLDVMSMKHETTDEESVKSLESSWSWLVISLATVIIILIIVIVWYVLRENEKFNEELPPGVIRPVSQQRVNPNFANRQQPQRYSPRQMQQLQRQAQQAQQAFQAQQRQAQTEQLPIESKSLQEVESKQPTKQELEKTLRQLNQDSNVTEVSTEQGHVVSNDSKTPENDDQNSQLIETTIETTGGATSNNDQNQESPSAQESNQDSKMATAFYQNLQQQVDMENEDSDEEEGRDEECELQ